MLSLCQPGVDLSLQAPYVPLNSQGASRMKTVGLIAGTIAALYLIIVILPLAIG